MSASMTTQNTLVRQMAYTPRSLTIKVAVVQAALERDALLELKRDERRKSETIAEELRVARLELSRLQVLKDARSSGS